MSSTPLGDQEVSQLGQAPGGERQVVVMGTGQGELLDLAALRSSPGASWLLTSRTRTRSATLPPLTPRCRRPRTRPPPIVRPAHSPLMPWDNLACTVDR
jgi:hypothetical protein